MCFEGQEQRQSCGLSPSVDFNGALRDHMSAARPCAKHIAGREVKMLAIFFYLSEKVAQVQTEKTILQLFNICIEFGLGCHYTFWIKEATILWTELNAWKHNSPLLIEYFNRSAMWSSVMSVAPPAHYDRVVVAVYFSSRFMIFTCYSKANSHS